MNLIDKFLQLVQANPAAPACIIEGRVMRRGMLAQLVANLALALHQRGVQPGEVIGVSMPQPLRHLAVLLALARLGAVSLPVHPNSPGPARLRLMERYGARRLICVGGKETEGVECLVLDDIKAGPGAEPGMRFTPYWPSPETPARLSLTSGTTGIPSAILYTQAYWLSRIEKSLGRADAGVRVMPADLHLTLGSISALGALFNGGIVVFHPPGDLRSLANAINAYAVTHVLMPPALIRNLATTLPFDGQAFPGLRQLRSIGGSLSQPLYELARRKLTSQLFVPYGASEFGLITMATPQMLEQDPECAGEPVPGVELRVVDPEGKDLPAGESGEILARMPDMSLGYYLNPEKTAERFVDGWYRTRDVGFLSPQGLLRIEGRLDDRLNVEGVKFYPERVESVLAAHPGVEEAAVFSLRLDDGRHIVAALVVPRGKPPFEPKLGDYCAEKQLGKTSPRRFIVVDALPRNESGKVVRSELAGMLKGKPEPVVH